MKSSLMSPLKVLGSFIPISRFNRGEASKIIGEVKRDGVKFIVKNNTPECVLMSVEDYKRMLEEIEDAELAAIALEREARDEGSGRVTMDALMAEHGITQADLDAIDDSEIAFE